MNTLRPVAFVTCRFVSSLIHLFNRRRSVERYSPSLRGSAQAVWAALCYASTNGPVRRRKSMGLGGPDSCCH